LVHAGADLAQLPQQLFVFVHVPIEEQPAANTVTANIPANTALFILALFLLWCACRLVRPRVQGQIGWESDSLQEKAAALP